MALLRGDGHYGVENRETARLGVDRFLLALSYLIEDPTRAHLVIHIRPTGGYLSDLTSGRFLELLGYTKFSGECPLLHEPCFYRYVFESPVNRTDRRVSRQQVEYAGKRFRALAETLPSIYEQIHDIYTKLGSIPDLFPHLSQYGPQPLPDFSQEAPRWIDEVKVEQHQIAEQQLNEAIASEKYFSAVEYILWGTGEKLEKAVQFVLEDLGLEVHRTPKGSTVDRIVHMPGTDLTFGFEITGLNDAIKKSSNKIGQASAFLQQREGTERPIILANTFNDRPLADRSSEPDFTPEAIDLMQPKIVGMTTVTLYEVWKGVKYGNKGVKAFAKKLYDHPGGEFLLDK